MMRCPPAEIDWLARSPPWREPACPEDGESVLTFGESATRFRYSRPLSGSSTIPLFSITVPTVAFSCLQLIGEALPPPRSR